MAAGDGEAERVQGLLALKELPGELRRVAIQVEIGASWVAEPRQISRFCMRAAMRSTSGSRGVERAWRP
jgi:hypothetical protein